jgi:hypothetical protein
LRSVRAALFGGPILVLAGLAAISSAACSRHAPVQEADTDEEDAGAFGPYDASFDAADAADARDARSDEELAALADAGRLCGDKALPDCPLQGWMKRNAKTMINFGETTTLAETFDQMVAFVPPPKGLTRETFANWASIARDGANASRMGNIPAARAACRGCHSEYLRSYHLDYRALPLPPLAPGSLPPSASSQPAPAPGRKP